MATYTYSISSDFPYGEVDSDLLVSEIGASTIIDVLENVSTSGDNCYITFTGTLSGPEVAELTSIVESHNPAADAPPSVLSSGDIIDDITWAEFKKYIDGTIANLYFYTQTLSGSYIITTDFHGGFRHRYELPFTDTADKTDYDTNFAPVQNQRRPYEQLQLTNKDATITYLPNGDIDTIETVIGDKKKVDQFNYTGPDLTSITTTIVDV